MKIDMKQPILDKNDAIARELRERFAEHHVYVVDLLASPGSGKTSTILATIDALRDEFNIAVIEGDIASSVDAEKIKAQGIAAVQINTGGACHLESAMIKRAIDVLDLERLDLIIVENVGNLVCPTDFDLGENAKVMILSVPEGDDKPLKYPGVFQVSEAVILNKVDTMPVFNFNQEAFEESVKHYKHPEKVAVTGTPVREDFFTLTKEAAKEKLGVNDGRPLIVSFWGSLGASGMNAQMADMLALEAGKEPFHHIHGAGKSGYAAVLKALAEKGVDLKDHPSLQVREYIYDMAPVMRAADLVICRAGASTVSELTALGVPAIMVPSPYVTNNHQEKNARALETHGGVEVLLEQDSSGQALFQTAAGILHDDVRREAMASAMAELGIRDAAQRIYETVQELL